ncbi:hypothetical protein DPMN_033714 [Dreissena polymorpha]|uniref:Uncharacterized protein n=1 Tax=Dreissena polymorpha TaxID=45954 RepID=A0A9D4RLE4_DREPO|nr:hypothetical protein DPMN_033714 [Dreissena polymorpha]
MGTLLFEVSVNASHDATQCNRLVFIIIILANGEVMFVNTLLRHSIFINNFRRTL